MSGSRLGVRETGDDFNNLSCDLCKVVMELLDAFITDEVTEEQVRTRRIDGKTQEILSFVF